MSSQNNAGNNNNPFSNENEQDKIINKLKLCMYMLFGLAFIRIFAFQFFWMFNDLIASLIVYCTYTSKGKFMAIFCIINGVMGIIYQISLAPIEMSKYKSSIDSSEHEKINKNNIVENGNQTSNFNDLNNDPNVFNDNKMNSHSSIDLFFTLLIINMILSIIIYSLNTYFSYKAFQIFREPFGEIDNENEELRNYNNNNNNYGGVHNNNQEHNNRNNNGFVAFTGSGHTVGTAI